MNLPGLYQTDYEHDACGVGLLVQVHGRQSHDLVEHALKVLEHMVHRGAERPDQTGDGAGIQVQLPDTFLRSLMPDLPPFGRYGSGLAFLPVDVAQREEVLHLLREEATRRGLLLQAVREVPICPDVLGEEARKTCPFIAQLILSDQQQDKGLPLELRLYLVRKAIEQALLHHENDELRTAYIVSLSSRTMVYKGMLSSRQLRLFYPDLMHPLFRSAIALVHSRFSTNTFPTWALAQPFRLIGHNGEINTIRGNRRWMEARESVLQPADFSMEEIAPVLQPGMSDSASLDNVLEFFLMSGMSLPHALAMMVPESFNRKNPIPPALKSFYEFHSILMEAWDGPAALLFSDGRYAGGMLDRNGLRPGRYVLTQNDTLVIASEAGVLNLPVTNIKHRGRLRPGKILMVDTETGTILYDKQIKEQLMRAQPYGDWLALNRINLADISSGRKVKQEVDDADYKWRAFRYSDKEIKETLQPMVLQSQEPSASMGNDAPLPCFATRPQLLADYFRQQFAQVTNPPIDPIREELVMSLSTDIGMIGHNLLDPGPVLCKMVVCDNPILTNRELDLLRNLSYKGFRTRDVSLVFPDSPDAKLEDEVERICQEALAAVEDGVNYVVLTDKSLHEGQLAVPSVLAVSALHNYLIARRKRVQTAILVEAGDVREVMHFALLMGYGASAVCPYMALGLIDRMCREGEVQLDFNTAERHYIKAVNKGLRKILSKMGISTLGSYKGAGLFEAVGLNADVLDRYFSGTRSAFSGVGLDRIFADLRRMVHPEENEPKEARGWTPQQVRLLQRALREDDYSLYRSFAEEAGKGAPVFIRQLLRPVLSEQPVTEEVTEEDIRREAHRIVAGAISFGAISDEAHRTLAEALNRFGGRSNTGEGGEDSARFDTLSNSRIKQVASGRFGVTAEYLMHAEEIQIKVAQGAKPGEGGQLPGFKVGEVIARTRHSIPGITLISPPPHHDIYSIEDLAQLIYDLKTLNPTAMVSVKLVSESGVGTIAAGVAKAGADNIVISGGCGGTGASPASSIRYAGMPAETGLAEAQQTLILNGLRERVTLQTDGQLKTGRDLVIMALLGAEEFALSTGFMIAEGCLLCRSCHTNKCPVGIATQDVERRKKFAGEAEHIIRYATWLLRDALELIHRMGFRSFEDIIGRTDLLQEVDTRFSFERLLYKPAGIGHRTQKGRTAVINPLEERLLTESAAAVREGRPTYLMHAIMNTHRSIGAGVSGQVALRHGEAGLPEGTLRVDFAGSAGQSFGAFLTHGVHFHLSGEANDYAGKGLSGGRISIVPPQDHTLTPEDNTIAGNTLLYGATSGAFFANGKVGERFAVRNSGAVAVVEGTGDHCCEYMTGGRVVVLGSTGRNFAAGMSGGIAYVWNRDGNFDFFCNMESVELTLVEGNDAIELQHLLEEHVRYTGSPLAARLLADWPAHVGEFIKVLPVEYKQLLLHGE